MTRARAVRLIALTALAAFPAGLALGAAGACIAWAVTSHEYRYPLRRQDTQ